MSLSDNVDALAARVAEVLGLAGEWAAGQGSPVVSGQYYDQARTPGASTTIAGVAGQIDLAPFIVGRSFEVDRIGVACSTAVASALCKALVYAPDAAGWPGALVYASSNLDLATTGYKYDAWAYTFQPGTRYWVGAWTSSTATLRGVPLANAISLGLPANTGSTYLSAIRRTVTWGGSAPSPWTFSAAELTAAVIVPSVRFRAV